MAVFVALTIGILAGWASASLADRDLQVEVFRYVLLISNGAILFVTALSHLFRPSFMARELDWPPGGPFQTVVGVWNLGASVICLIAFLGGATERTLAAVLVAIFWTGAATLHWSAVVRSGAGPARLQTAVAETALVATLVYFLAVEIRG